MRATLLRTMLVAAVAAPAAAQAQNPRLSIPQDSLGQLTAGIPDSTLAVIKGYLIASDSAARSSLYRLRSERRALPFLIYVLRHERLPEIRANVAGMLSSDGFDDRTALLALRERIEKDTSFTVIRQSTQALEQIAQRQRRLALIPAVKV